MTLKNYFQLIPVEHVCLALAIVNAIGMGLSLVGSIVMMFHFIVNIQIDGQYFSSGGHSDTDKIFLPGPAMGIFVGILIALLVLASLVSFIFAVVLCNGVYNHRPGQVKAYFIFGVVITTVAVQISASVLYSDPPAGLFGLFGCVIQSLFLVLVYQTYLKFNKEALFKNYVHLLEY